MRTNSWFRKAGLQIVFLMFFLALFPNVGKTQNFKCGFDLVREKAIKESPMAAYKEELSNQLINNCLINNFSRNIISGGTIVIPIVVHIIHVNGPENISDAAVISGINQLNERFQNAGAYYDATGHAMNIQFCLATIDPQGNPTTGITRNISGLSYLNGSDDIQMKNLNRWDPLYYFNVWTVNSIYGFNVSTAGYATLPSNLGDPSDGVVVLASYLNSDVLNHETGHYLGLYHTWGLNLTCVNQNCLLDGDMVCDTPPDTSRTGCMGNSCSSELDDTTGLSPFTMDMDELPNYMDYTACPLSFSQGQGDRMSAALTQIRFQLLQSYGCGFTGGAAPVAQMSYEISFCNDGHVHFYDSLSLNASSVNWDFDNDGVYDSFAHNPVFTFSATGTYTVKLLVVGQGGVDSTFQTIFVQKAPSIYYPIVALGGLFQLNGTGYRSCRNFTNSLSSAPGVSYLWSNGDTTQSITFLPDSSYVLTLTMVDSAGLTWTNSICNPLYVSVQPLPPAPVIYSNDPAINCQGDTVTMYSIVNGSGVFSYLWYANSNLVAGANDSTYTSIGNMTNQWYQLFLSDTNGCFTFSNIIYSNFYAPPVQQSLTQNGLDLVSGWGSGNQWYLDDVLIPGATGTTYTVSQPGCYRVAWFFPFAPECQTLSDSICFLTVRIREGIHENLPSMVYEANFKIIRLTGPITDSGNHFQLFDAGGRKVSEVIFGENLHHLDVSELPAGLYLGRLVSKTDLMVTKIIIH
jgi:PKD repeat protein